jgi:hypothetical protein
MRHRPLECRARGHRSPLPDWPIESETNHTLFDKYHHRSNTARSDASASEAPAMTMSHQLFTAPDLQKQSAKRTNSAKQDRTTFGKRPSLHIWTPPALQAASSLLDSGSDCRQYIRPLMRPSTRALMTFARRGLTTITVSEPPRGLSGSFCAGLTCFHQQLRSSNPGGFYLLDLDHG